jgi:nucleoside-diphosphate-sugar epimerase
MLVRDVQPEELSVSKTSQQVVITGAGGFIGSRLVDALLTDVRFSAARFTLLDQALPDRSHDQRIKLVEGDIRDEAIRRKVLGDGVDLIFHLAAILGGAAEANYLLSRQVNVDATLSLFERLRNESNPPRVVFASSIAVFGPDMPAQVDDSALPSPSMVYGSQKLMMEDALGQFSRRGWIDGLAIRLPGIVARPGADASLKSAFINNIFFAYARGEDFVMPVSPDGTIWLISVANCVESFLHAGTLDGSRIGTRRAFNLPAQRVRMSELIAELKRVFPRSGSRISFEPIEALQTHFASYPPLTTEIADSLNFTHDGDLRTLVLRALAAGGIDVGVA